MGRCVAVCEPERESAPVLSTLRDKKRILIIGSGGAGKSTFARALAARTGLPLIHLDRHYWRAGWRATPDAQWNTLAAQLAVAETWIMDGNYGASLPIRLRRCDAVVFFDFPRLVCLRGVIRRRFVTGHRTRPDMAPGCPERLNWEFMRWIWNYPRSSRVRITQVLQNLGAGVEIIAVTRRSDCANLLLACGNEPA